MEQRGFIKGDGYQVGDNVLIGHKMWRIQKIVKDEATLTYYGIGGEEKITRKLSSLPQQDVLVKIPEYKKDQKLDNGWVVVRPSVKGKYMVNTGDDTVEMAALDIKQAEQDHRKALLDSVINTPLPDEIEEYTAVIDEDKIHQDAEAFARKRLEKEHSASRQPSPPTPLPEVEGNTRIPTEKEMATMLSSLLSLEEQIKRIDKRLSKIDEMAETVKAYGDRLDALESPHPSPLPMVDGTDADDKVTVKTLTGQVGNAFDAMMASYLADGWSVLYQSVDAGQWTVMLKKEKQQINRDVTSISLVDAVSRSRVPKTVNGTIVDPAGDGSPYMTKAGIVTGDAARLARQWDMDLVEQTYRMMGDVS